ncbi:NUDIX hydrolase YfcD [Aeromonas sanarellii]|uniref:NUDIX hydrolase YfcD n=1 Tax=Aeromonas sanarellii TaxID=633415 RepID=UPI0039A1FA18
MTKVPHVEWVDIVDEQDRVIGVAERARVRRENLRHRASYILVLDEQERVLVQRRTLGKDFCPGMLDACAGGVVTQGEAMEPSARRELAEELGIHGVPLQDFGAFYAEGEASGGGYRVWGGLFSCHYQGPVQLQAEEVSEVHWMSLGEIAERAAEFTPDSLLAIATWQARRSQSGQG